jgi:Na+/melibiose symporter-like transporter
MATTIGSLSNPLGCILGYGLGSLFVFDSDLDDIVVGKEHVRYYLWFSAILITCLNIPILLFFIQKPKEFPSEAAMQNESIKFSFKDDLKLLMKNKNYWWFTLSWMMTYSTYTVLGAILNELVSPFNFTPANTSVMGATFILSGLLSSFVVGGLLTKTRKYLLIYKVQCVLILMAIIAIPVTLPTENMLIFNTNVAALGALLLPMIPFGFSFSIEISYPVSEAMSNGILILIS